MLTHKELKKRALQRGDVRKAYDQMEEEFGFLDELLRARTSAGITQAQVAERIGTTQSAIARLESGNKKHSPSVATLQKYAQALGCRLEVRLVHGTPSSRTKGRTTRSTRRSILHRRSSSG